MIIASASEAFLVAPAEDVQRSETQRPASTVAVFGAFVADEYEVPKSTAEVNRFTAEVFIPSVSVQEDLYTLNAAAAPVHCAAKAT